MPQNRPKLPSINLQQYPQNFGARSRALVAGFTGAVNDTVLLWTGANDTLAPTTSSGITITNDANLGTSVLIDTPGIYVVRLSLEVNTVGTPTIVAGINIGGAGLTGDPSYANCVALGRVLIVTADDVAGIELVTTIVVAEAGQTIPVRFQASNGAGAAPAAASLAVANCLYSIDRVDSAA